MAREAEGSGGAAMKWPLIGSAAGHLAILAFLLLFLRAATGPGFPVAVQVVLVEEARGNGSTEARPAAGVPGGARRFPAVRVEPEPVSPPPSVPGTSLPAPFAPPEGRAPSVSNPLSSSLLLLPARVAVETSSAGPPGGERFGGGGSPRAGSGKGESTATLGPSGGARMASLTVPGLAGKAGKGEGPEVRLLRERIESRIVYPEEAIRRGQEGEVLLRIRVGEGGVPGEIRIARSSGARALDEAARNGVARAAPLPSRPGWFEVPVRFFLR